MGKGDTNEEVEGGYGDILRINKNRLWAEQMKEMRNLRHLRRSTVYPYYTNTVDLLLEAAWKVAE